jgi:hypothetical protein
MHGNTSLKKRIKQYYRVVITSLETKTQDFKKTGVYLYNSLDPESHRNFRYLHRKS